MLEEHNLSSTLVQGDEVLFFEYVAMDVHWSATFPISFCHRIVILGRIVDNEIARQQTE